MMMMIIIIIIIITLLYIAKQRLSTNRETRNQYRSNQNLMLAFLQRWKLEYWQKTLSQLSGEPTSSAHTWRQLWSHTDRGPGIQFQFSQGIPQNNDNMIFNFLWDYTIHKPVDLFLLKQTNKSKSGQEQIGEQITGLTFRHDETNQTDYCKLGCSTGKNKIECNFAQIRQLICVHSCFLV